MNYFINVNGEKQGPYTVEERRQRHSDSNTLVWTDGMPQWLPAGQVEELKPLFGQDSAKAKKVWKWVGIAAVGLLLIMAISNPSRDEHKQVIMQHVTNGIEQGLEGNNDTDDPFKIFGTAVLKAMATPVVNGAIDNMLQYHNYLFWSTTTIALPDSNAVRTSLGLFGKVFTSDEATIADAVAKAVGDNGDDQSTATEEDTYDNNGGNGESNVSDGTDVASQVTDSVMSIGSRVGRKVASNVSRKVSSQIKKEISENTDSTTASGIDKIIDAVESMLKGL